ncbi:MAG: hypothetical protein R2941_24120 [Desulfobacterales bacterium]
MPVTVSQYKNELLNEIEGMSADKLRQILDFICFIKAKEVIDPSQSWFWTKQWQKMEGDADNDKHAGNIVGNGTLDDLLSELKQ